jgi:hypothetical protein
MTAFMRGNLPALKIAGIGGIIIVGLWLDVALPRWGQPVANVLVWLSLVAILAGIPRAQRLSLLICMLYATIGEIMLSLVWGLYEYRLHNIPLFVPPGHALLFLLGTLVAPGLNERVTWAIPLLAAPFVILLGVTGVDTMGLPLFALLIACMAFGPAKKLYAAMFMLALVMEIYGTWLVNWTWAPRVPGLGLTTINPPLAAGVFYCALDLLVTATNAALERRRPLAPRLAIDRASQP